MLLELSQFEFPGINFFLTDSDQFFFCLNQSLNFGEIDSLLFILPNLTLRKLNSLVG
jgi:hypothetical protein